MDFANIISLHGQSVVLANYTDEIKRLSKTYDITEQRVLMLDFDCPTEYSISDLRKDDFMKENACFFYETFSSSPSENRFRVVFLLEEPLITNKAVEEAYKYLFDKYPMCDTSVGQTSRIFYGSRKGYKVINMNNRLSLDNNLVVLNEKEDFIVTNNTPNYLLFKYKRWDILKERYGETYSALFSSHMNVSEYVKSLDIREVLELPDENPFIDILHDEKSPSASVYFAEEYNTYFYKCFSQSKPFTGDITNLLSKYLGVSSTFNALEILMDVMGLQIDISGELARQKFSAENFRKALMKGDLETRSPNLYKYIKRYMLEINATLDLLFDYIYFDKETGEPKYINYYSLTTLRTQVSKMLQLPKPISEMKMWNIMNVIMVTEMAYKLPQGDIPVDIYENIIEKQLNTDMVRTSNVYTPSNFTEENIEVMEDIAKVLLEKNVTVSSLSYEMIYRLFSEEKANKLFPQAYQPLKDKGLVSMSSKDTQLTKKSIQVEDSVVKIIFKGLEKDNYILEEDILIQLSRNLRINKKTAYNRYVKVRPDIISKYGLIRSKYSKKLSSELNLNDDKTKNKFLIYKEKTQL